MTKKALKILGWTLLLTAFTGCQKEEATDDNAAAVRVNLAFSVAKPAGNVTRMTDEVVQENGQPYRGFHLQQIIPFTVRGEIHKSDRPLRTYILGNEQTFNGKESPNAAFYRYNYFNSMRGTASYLVYGRANADNVTDKATYGSLVANFPVDQLPANISFKAEAIHAGTGSPLGETRLADYLTNVANSRIAGGTEGDTITWSQATNSWLQTVYQNFIGQRDEGYALMAGSTTNVITYVNVLYKALTEKTFTEGSVEARLKAEIQKRIRDGYRLFVTFDETANKVTALSVNYPDNGLPDGAAVLQWSKYDGRWRFMPQTETTTLAQINSIDRYSYPAELYYYTNSTIKTSDQDVNTDANYQSKTRWDGEGSVLALYPAGEGVVEYSTKSAAIIKPLQYGVARLKVCMKADQNVLADDNGNYVDLSATPQAFPVTGVIACNQHPVGFDFKPATYSASMSTTEDKFIYDTKVQNSSMNQPYYLSTEEQTLPSTLVLQSYDNEEVTIILEFRNDSGVTFHGKDGLVYPGTKFYLIAKIKPAAGSTEDWQKRVFTQDYVTTVKVKVVSGYTGLKSLANAYNVLPDVLGGKLEVGVMLTPDWIQATPTNTVLE